MFDTSLFGSIFRYMNEILFFGSRFGAEAPVAQSKRPPGDLHHSTHMAIKTECFDSELRMLQIAP
jgi:hypothetical protein